MKTDSLPCLAHACKARESLPRNGLHGYPFPFHGAPACRASAARHRIPSRILRTRSLPLTAQELPLPEWAAGASVATVAAVTAAVGAVYCFFGYRAFRFVLGLTGFALAGGVAAVLAGWLSHGHLVAMAVSGVIGGIAGILAVFFLYRAGVFLIGFLGAALTAQNILQGRPESWIPWAILGAGCAGGLLALASERIVMTLATAAIGAWLVVCAAAVFLAGPEVLEWPLTPEEATNTHWIMVASWGVLAIAGALAQFATRKRDGKTARKEE